MRFIVCATKKGRVCHQRGWLPRLVKFFLNCLLPLPNQRVPPGKCERHGLPGLRRRERQEEGQGERRDGLPPDHGPRARRPRQPGVARL